MAMKSPRINIALLLCSTLLLLICLFSQVMASDGKKEREKIQELGEFAVDVINDATKRYFQFYGLLQVEDSLLSFNEVYTAVRRREGGGEIKYTLFIRAQSGKGREMRLKAFLRTVGDSKELLQSYYIS